MLCYWMVDASDTGPSSLRLAVSKDDLHTLAYFPHLTIRGVKWQAESRKRI